MDQKHSFEDIAQEGTTHFESLFKVDSRANIDTIIRVVVSSLDSSTQKKITNSWRRLQRKNLRKSFTTFRRTKSQDQMGSPIEFYKGCFEIIGEDLLKLIEYTRRYWKDSCSLQCHFYCPHSKGGQPNQI
jgi:hypothetical protein